jgi:hypothetical protein
MSGREPLPMFLQEELLHYFRSPQVFSVGDTYKEYCSWVKECGIDMYSNPREEEHEFRVTLRGGATSRREA